MKRIASVVRDARREFVFRRAMRRFLRAPERCAHPDHAVLRDLVRGWGNEEWSALEELLAACVDQALTVDGPILECGSGLTTIVMGAIAKRRGQHVWALEHRPEWGARVQACLDRYGLDCVTLHTKPLRDHAEFSWYDPPLASMPDRFSSVVVDGPPGGTKGGRYGLLPLMRKRLAPGCVLLLDDADREGEQAVGRRWETELGAPLEIRGQRKPYFRMTVPTLPVDDAALTFFMSVHRDHDLAVRCLRRLRQHYPQAAVIVRSDGDDDPRHHQLVEEFGVDYRLEPRLFPYQNGAALVARMFALYLEQPTPFLFKIDPDTVLHRRFRFLPAREGHFGTLQGEPDARSVQGGCMGFTRAAAESFHSSGLLEDPRLADPVPHEDVTGHWLLLAARARGSGLASFDWTLGWAASELGIPMFDFPEVRSVWKAPVDNADLEYAVTHPAPG